MYTISNRLEEKTIRYYNREFKAQLEVSYCIIDMMYQVATSYLEYTDESIVGMLFSIPTISAEDKFKAQELINRLESTKTFSYNGAITKEDLEFAKYFYTTYNLDTTH